MNNNNKSNTTINTENNIKVSKKNSNNEKRSIEQLNLIPIDTVDSKSENIYKKYGIEFSGNCYTCDLAEIAITEQTLKLTNVCDVNLNREFEIIKITNAKSEIEIKTQQSDFIFTEIDKTPIYELKITGKEINAENLRISKYYTLKKLLKKFEQHDCGDFEG
ncbi:hypothetical protein BXU10_13650 [Flavobacterium sp. LM4]|nr:hypothetical protein BXU10_13650 [Flavobacterium sp. LM4]